MALAQLCLCVSAADAKPSFDFSPAIRQIYSTTWNAKWSEAVKLIDAQKRANPDNQLLYWANCHNTFWKALFSKEDADYQAFIKLADDALDDLTTVSGETNAWYYFVESEINLQYAILIAIHESPKSSLNRFTKAWNAASNGVLRHTSFAPNKINYWMLKGAVDCVPSNYKWLTKSLGFSGKYSVAIAKFEALRAELDKSAQYKVFHDHCLLMHSILKMAKPATDELPATTFQFIKKDLGNKLPTQGLTSYFYAVMALQAKDNDAAYNAISPLASTSSFPELAQINYVTGITLLQKADKKGGAYFIQFLKQYKGDQYKDIAWLRLGWAYRLANNEKKANDCFTAAIDFGNGMKKGGTQACQDAEASKALPVSVIKARLLIDGGYFDKAILALKASPELETSTIPLIKADYLYRYGRALQLQEKHSDAIAKFKLLIEVPRVAKSYLWASACMQIAEMLIASGKGSAAKTYLDKATTWNDHHYKEAFETQIAALKKKAK